MKRHWMARTAVVVALVAAGCGGDNGSSQSRSTTDQSTDATDDRTTPTYGGLIQPSVGEVIRNEAGGFSFTMIDGWNLSTMFADTGSLQLDSKVQDFGAGYVTGEGPTITLMGFVPDGATTFERVVKRGLDFMARHYQATTSGTPQASVAGLEATAYDFDYDLSGAGAMKSRSFDVQVTPQHFLYFQCWSKAELWNETLAACNTVISSITVFEPTPASS